MGIIFAVPKIEMKVLLERCIFRSIVGHHFGVS